jgi:MoaA/NifB/PqqE/SkfB family radical SAM enzyme
MEKIKFKYLDIPIIRSCNLGCVGCITHSDHKNIRGVVKLDESLEWLKFWSERLDPETITLFGGEPLLHPKFVDWARAVRKLWPDALIVTNTNGFYIPNLFDNIEDLFLSEVGLSVIVSIHIGTEPSISKVKNNIELLKQKILAAFQRRRLSRRLPENSIEWKIWLDESETSHKQWWALTEVTTTPNLNHFCKLTVCEQYQLPWTQHYTGIGESMRPTYDYNDEWYKDNHRYCQAKSFVTLYKGVMYKCPPVGVLAHTLNTFNLSVQDDWKPYLDNYQIVTTTSTDAEIQDWFKRQEKPELVCNMCGYAGPNGASIQGVDRDRHHEFKDHWNYTL